MKVMGIVVIIIGLILVYVGITGNQHNFMAALTGSAAPINSGLALSPSGIYQGGGNAQAATNTSSNSSSSSNSSTPPEAA